MTEQTTLSTESKTAIDRELQKFPADQKQSAVLFALKWVQKENGGHLTKALMNAVADYLTMPAIAVYEVASFYSMYDLNPVGRHKVSVCNSISCMLRGSEELYEHIQKRYKLDEEQTSPDGKFTLKECECLGACIGAPAVQIDDQYHEKLDKEKLEELINALD
ncbi:MAG: NAD(P)H-dependent oxidoreductase subunit E [Pseudomonadota bacterium]